MDGTPMAAENLKISDFGIAVESQLQTNSLSHFQGDFHYISQERLHGADRIAANDIWSVGATVVHMILNHFKTVMNILQYKLCVNEMPYNEYLITVNEFPEENTLANIVLQIISGELLRAAQNPFSSF